MTDPVSLQTLQMQYRCLDGASRTASGTQSTADHVSSADAPTFREMLRDCLEQAVQCGGLGNPVAFPGNSAAGAVSDGRAGDMQASGSLIGFVAAHEGFSSTPYRGADVQNQTVGYGHVITEGENLSSLTESQAVSLLKDDLKGCVASVNREFAGTDLTQSQFDSLVSFAYNLGENIWGRATKLTSDIKSGADAQTLKDDFTQFDHCNGQELRGLYRRRVDEWEMFTSGVYRGQI